MPRVTLLRSSELAAVMEIQDQAYPHIGHDSLEVFADKIRVFPAGCRGAWLDDRLAGYLFSHPWTCWWAATLDRPLHLPTSPDCYYLHDLAVADWAQGRGVARALVQSALDLAQQRGLAVQALVAVQKSQQFWSQFGFVAADSPPPKLRRKLLEYSSDASYMMRNSI